MQDDIATQKTRTKPGPKAGARYGSRQMEYQMSIRFEKSMAEDLQKIAEAHGLSIAHYIRKILWEKLYGNKY
jgi:predicted HicB family RNase H-like nuclease